MRPSDGRRVGEGGCPQEDTSILAKLRLQPAEEDHRRVLAVLRYLGEG
jgi:hypothetical protein